MTLTNFKEGGKVKKLVYLLLLFLILTFVKAENLSLVAFVGQISELEVTTDQDLTYENFSIEIDGNIIREFSVKNTSLVNYNVLFRVPQQEGEYNLFIKAGETELIGSLIVKSVNLTIETSYDLNQMSNLAYVLEEDYIWGFASESQPIFSENQIVTSGSAYIFLTLPNSQLINANDFLEKEEFSNQINPLFGFPSLSSYFLSIYLEYPDIQILGDDIFQFGRHNLLIERVFGEDTKTVSISIMNEEDSELIITEE